MLVVPQEVQGLWSISNNTTSCDIILTCKHIVVSRISRGLTYISNSTYILNSPRNIAEHDVDNLDCKTKLSPQSPGKTAFFFESIRDPETARIIDRNK